jgi:hypothetical protein
MTIQNNNLHNGLGVNQAMEKYFKAQEKRFYEFLKDKSATATSVHKETGIEQKNITRYKRNLEKKGLLKEVKKVICPITRHPAWEITTDQNQFPKLSQLPIFDND